jgi:RluA family pseudouridine synthase
MIKLISVHLRLSVVTASPLGDLWFNRAMDILHLDDQIIVINKPAGLSVLPDGWEPDANYLLKMLEEKYENPSTPLQGQAGSGQRLWVVHRLDKITSGVMVFARTADAHRALNSQFERHEVEKVYHAIVEGNPVWEEKVCKMPLRTNIGHKHRTAVDHKRGKPAETIFKVLKRWQPEALLEARPLTGRTHQIRAHLYALRYPLLGDVLYGASQTDLIARPALHALSLSFVHPQSGERVSYFASYPNDLQQLMERFKL